VSVDAAGTDQGQLPPGVAAALATAEIRTISPMKRELALGEVRRVLVPGGRLLVCDMMFALSLNPRDRRVILDKLLRLGRHGPAGLLRIAKNGLRILTRTWEHPAPAASWEQMLARRHFTDISVRLLEHEAGVALARRPEPGFVVRAASGGTYPGRGTGIDVGQAASARSR
jgi:hypothetical protein